MEHFNTLLRALEHNDYTCTERPCVSSSQTLVYRVTDSKQPDWSCFLSYEIYDERTKIVLTSGDEFYRKVYETHEWKDALDDIFFMYHCIAK